MTMSPLQRCGFQCNNIFYNNVNENLGTGTWSNDSKVNVLHNNEQDHDRLSYIQPNQYDILFLLVF